MPRYLRYLRERLAAHDVVIEQRTVRRLPELSASETDAVVNTSGLGARDLVPDSDVRPVQGHLVVVENPGIDSWFVEATGGGEEALYISPQSDEGTVILGGTAYENQWSLTPDPAITKRIIDRCAEIHPALGDARVIEERVGLRPYRSHVRVERQDLPDGLVCVHCYGHGGSGVTVSLASAEAAVRLLRQA
ncbi:FAD-dependent oxidoreductase [Streptomyces xiamenensis]|uniref:FAD-dependent oxidoreductase n=1 Tax=Streptomyces xiamenensis TaxID=408015 RepID=UPI0035DC64E4